MRALNIYHAYVACLEAFRIIVELIVSLVMLAREDAGTDKHQWLSLSAPLAVCWPLIYAGALLLSNSDPLNFGLLLVTSVPHIAFSVLGMSVDSSGGMVMFCAFNIVISLLVASVPFTMLGSSYKKGVMLDEASGRERMMFMCGGFELLRIAAELICCVQIYFHGGNDEIKVWALAGAIMSIGWPFFACMFTCLMCCVTCGGAEIAPVISSVVMTSLGHLVFYLLPIIMEWSTPAVYVFCAISMAISVFNGGGVTAVLLSD